MVLSEASGSAAAAAFLLAMAAVFALQCVMQKFGGLPPVNLDPVLAAPQAATPADRNCTVQLQHQAGRLFEALHAVVSAFTKACHWKQLLSSLPAAPVIEMNLNLSGFFNVFRCLASPSLCLPHATVSTFSDLPIPLDKAFDIRNGKSVIKAVVLDKDDCFAYPNSKMVHESNRVSRRSWNDLRASSADLRQDHFEKLRAAYPGRRLLIVSNTSGAQTYDRDGKLASEVEEATGVTVLSHRVKKPGCAAEIMEYFHQHPETGVTGPHQIAVVGDRLFTDMMLANRMGSWGIWVKDGIVPLKDKSIVSIGLQFTWP